MSNETQPPAAEPAPVPTAPRCLERPPRERDSSGYVRPLPTDISRPITPDFSTLTQPDWSKLTPPAPPDGWSARLSGQVTALPQEGRLVLPLEISFVPLSTVNEAAAAREREYRRRVQEQVVGSAEVAAYRVAMKKLLGFSKEKARQEQFLARLGDELTTAEAAHIEGLAKKQAECQGRLALLGKGLGISARARDDAARAVYVRAKALADAAYVAGLAAFTEATAKIELTEAGLTAFAVASLFNGLLHYQWSVRVAQEATEAIIGGPVPPPVPTQAPPAARDFTSPRWGANVNVPAGRVNDPA